MLKRKYQQHFQAIKDVITKADGELGEEEEPKKLDLAYEIVKQIDGKNQQFQSAYFGWVRFKIQSGAIEAINEEIETNASILRHLLIRLN